MTAPISTPTSASLSLADLRPRERAVLGLLAEGHTNKEIARRLELSKNVVDKILSNTSNHYSIYPKIGVENAKGAVAWYLRQVEDPDGAGGRSASRPVVLQGIPIAALAVAEPADTHGDEDNQGSARFLTAFITVYVALVALVFIPIWLQGGTNAVLVKWGNAYAVLPLMAGMYGLWHLRAARQGISKRTFGGLKLLSAGLICWVDGVVISVVYSLVTQSATPYPSLADIGYVAQDVCFAVAFVLWWREFSRRGALRSWLWAPIAAFTTIGYLAVQYSIRDLGTDLRITPVLPVLELTYASLASVCLGVAVCFLIPAIARTPATHLQAAFRFISTGMVFLFLAGTSFRLTANLTETHWLKFFNGNWVDLLFAAAFLLTGIGITLALQVNRSGAVSGRAPGRGFAFVARWGPALIGLVTLALAAAAATSRLPAGDQQNAGGQVQMVGDEGRRIRVEVDGRVLPADGTVPAYSAVSVAFRVMNNGGSPIALRSLTIGVRGPGVTCHDKNATRWSAPDVPFPAATDLTLHPGQVYEYRGSRAFYLPGAYFLEPVQQGVSETWGGIPPFSCVDLTVVGAGP